MSNLYNHIEQLGKEHGYKNITEFCRVAGVPRATMTELKMGRSKDLSKPNAQKFADAISVSLDKIYGTETEKAPSPIPGAERIDVSKYHDIPILGRIPAGLPLYAEQNIEGYTLTDLNGGAEYFALRISGDSMNAIGINDGYLIIVRRQEEVENGEVAVVMVGDDDATVKRFYATNNTVTLMPQSTNPQHTPQIYDTKKTKIKVLGKVVKVEFIL